MDGLATLISKGKKVIINGITNPKATVDRYLTK